MAVAATVRKAPSANCAGGAFVLVGILVEKDEI